jgi:integrase
VLPGDVGSPEFMAAYQTFVADLKPSASLAVKPAGTFGRLITDFYGSRPFRDLKPSSQKTYRYVLEPMAKAHGHRSVALMTHQVASKIIADIGSEKPGMANLTKSVLQTLMKFAVKEKWRDDNPMANIKNFKTGTHHTWTEGELQTFEKRWPLGTRQRLAYALLLHTGQRIGDVAKMHRADIVNGELHVIQEKTGVELYLPIVPEVEQALKAYPAKGLTLFGNERGQPISAKGIYQLLKTAIAEAGLPAKCVPHGLRKAAIRRLAEAGRSEKQIASVSGHKTLREIQRYTAAADQRRLARDAMRKEK